MTASADATEYMHVCSMHVCMRMYMHVMHAHGGGRIIVFEKTSFLGVNARAVPKIRFFHLWGLYLPYMWESGPYTLLYRPHYYPLRTSTDRIRAYIDRIRVV